MSRVGKSFFIFLLIFSLNITYAFSDGNLSYKSLHTFPVQYTYFVIDPATGDLSYRTEQASRMTFKERFNPTDPIVVCGRGGEKVEVCKPYSTFMTLNSSPPYRYTATSRYALFVPPGTVRMRTVIRTFSRDAAQAVKVAIRYGIPPTGSYNSSTDIPLNQDSVSSLSDLQESDRLSGIWSSQVILDVHVESNEAGKWLYFNFFGNPQNVFNFVSTVDVDYSEFKKWYKGVTDELWNNFDYVKPNVTDTPTPTTNQYIFPHLSNSPPWQTEIALLNYDTVSLSGTLSVRSASGSNISSISVTLPKDGRTVLRGCDEAAGTGAQCLPVEGRYAVFETESGSVTGYARYAQEARWSSLVPLLRKIETDDTPQEQFFPYLSPDSDLQGFVGIGLVNLSGAGRELRTMSQDGEAGTPFVLADKQHQAFVYESPTSTGDGTASASGIGSETRMGRILGAQGVYGIQLLGIDQGSDDDGSIRFASSYGMSLLGPPGNAVVYPTNIADSSYTSTLSIFNPALRQSVFIRFECYNRSGSLVRTGVCSETSQEIAPGTLSHFSDFPPEVTWVRGSSQQLFTGYGTLNSDTHTQMAAYELLNVGLKSGIIPVLDQEGQTWLTFINPGTGNATVSVTALNDNGDRLESHSMAISKNTSLNLTLDQLFPNRAFPETATQVRFESNLPLAAFLATGSADGTMMDAMPALDGQHGAE